MERDRLMRKKRWIVLLILTVLALFLFPACKGKDGGSKGDGGSTTQDPSSGQTTPTQNQIELPQDEFVEDGSADAEPESGNASAGASEDNHAAGASENGSGSTGTAEDDHGSAGTSGGGSSTDNTGDDGGAGNGENSSRDPIVLPEIDLD